MNLVILHPPVTARSWKVVYEYVVEFLFTKKNLGIFWCEFEEFARVEPQEIFI